MTTFVVKRPAESIWTRTAPQNWPAAAATLIVKLVENAMLSVTAAFTGSGIAAVPDYFALPHVHRGELRRVLPEWRVPAHTAWAVFPGRRLMPTKTRAFIDMLEAALAATDINATQPITGDKASLSKRHEK